jgi:hypothetical protein
VGTLTSLSSTGNITGGNLRTAGQVSATGAVIGATIQGNGSQLSGIVTSIVAGSGISVNAATGAVTVTATGGGGGTSISNGTSNVTIPTANGMVQISAGGGQTGGGAGLFVTDGANGGNINMSATNYININLVRVLGGLITNVVGLTSSGKINAGTAGVTAPFNGTQATKTGTSSGATGDICWDVNYIYVCTAGNTWKRVALSPF